MKQFLSLDFRALDLAIILFRSAMAMGSPDSLQTMNAALFLPSGLTTLAMKSTSELTAPPLLRTFIMDVADQRMRMYSAQTVLNVPSMYPGMRPLATTNALSTE